MSKCCDHCFSDNFLSSRIRNMSNEKGKCSYCKSENVALISPEALIDYFEPLLEIYLKDVNGELLSDLIQKDWNLFSISNTSVQQKLINNIMTFPQAGVSKFKPAFLRNDEIIERWIDFTKELKTTNRFIPKFAPEPNLFVEFGRFLGVIYEKNTQKMYRARISEDGKKFKTKDLKKPPAYLVLNGRANPVGIPYLYVASSAKTAIAEVRGHKSEKVFVLEYDIKNDLNLFDLRNPRQTISPFEQIEDLEFIYRHMPYLDLLEQELSKPVVPRRANLDYLSSQYLCELIKQMGYHGIIFKSSIDSGNNFVIFNDNRLKAGPVKEYEITEMKFETYPKT